MNSIKTLLGSLRWGWKASHENYREMCVLASTGQLGGPQMSELNEHIAACASCRDFLEDVSQLSGQVMPLLAEGRVTAADIEPPGLMKARFQARLAAQERMHEGPGESRLQPFLVQLPLAEMQKRAEKEARPRIPRPMVLSRLWRPAAILAAGCLVCLAAFEAGRRASTPVYPETSWHEGPVKQDRDPEANERLRRLEEQKLFLEARLAEMAGELRNAAGKQDELNAKLAATRERLAILNEQAGKERQLLAQEGQRVKNQASNLESEVVRLRWQVEDWKNKASSQQREAEELKNALQQTSADLQRQQDEQVRKAEMNSLVAARNLHIIDVYDTEKGGKPQRSFGRVFYVEGKSLIFYAYDLDDPRKLNTHVVFHVWGEKAGGKATAHSLGILHNDEKSRDRWALSFDDPGILAKIDSVFVTAEASTKGYRQPHGKKILFAYFGNPPNHP